MRRGTPEFEIILPVRLTGGEGAILCRRLWEAKETDPFFSEEEERLFQDLREAFDWSPHEKSREEPIGKDGPRLPEAPQEPASPVETKEPPGDMGTEEHAIPEPVTASPRRKWTLWDIEDTRIYTCDVCGLQSTVPEMMATQWRTHHRCRACAWKKKCWGCGKIQSHKVVQKTWKEGLCADCHGTVDGKGEENVSAQKDEPESATEEAPEAIHILKIDNPIWNGFSVMDEEKARRLYEEGKTSVEAVGVVRDQPYQVFSGPNPESKKRPSGPLKGNNWRDKRERNRLRQ